MNKKHLIIIIVVFFIGITGVVFYMNKSNDSELVDCDTQTSYSEEDNNDSKKTLDKNNNSNDVRTSSEDNKNKKIYVHICGEVNEPGVYELKEDARVIDAIEAAKGLTQAASQQSVNQAEKLEDSEQIYIPSIKEVKENVNQSVKSSDSNSSINNAENGKININTASQEELTTLPGIGVAKAQKIIAYRQQNGSFSKIEDIMKISGIKEGLFNKISENITV